MALNLVSPCDATTDWVSMGGGSLSIDTVDKKEGIGSLVDTSPTPSAINTWYATKYNLVGTWDWSAKKHILFWLKCDRPSTAFTNPILRMTDTLGNDGYWNLTFSAGEWTAFKLLLTLPDFGQQPNLTLIDLVQVQFQAVDTTPFYKKIDHLRVIAPKGMIGDDYFMYL